MSFSGTGVAYSSHAGFTLNKKFKLKKANYPRGWDAKPRNLPSAVWAGEGQPGCHKAYVYLFRPLSNPFRVNGFFFWKYLITFFSTEGFMKR
jgi:hypothetical protein